MGTKITRVSQKPFGGSGPTSDFGQFGSLAAAAKMFTKDPTLIQGLAAWNTGWAAAVVDPGQDRPCLEDENGVLFLAFYQLCYLLQQGVPEWDAGTEYFIGSVVQDGAGILYKSLVDNNLNNALTDASKWVAVFIMNTGGTVGSFKNLKGTSPSAATVIYTADELVLEDSSNVKVTVRSYNKTANITTSGAGGLDTGTEASNTWYYVWAIRKSSDGTTNILLSASSTSPTLPSGYDQKACIGSVRNNSSSDFVLFDQYGDETFYQTFPTMASGSSIGSTWQALDMSSFVPPISDIAFGNFRFHAPGNYIAGITNDSTVAFGELNPNICYGLFAMGFYWRLNIKTANTLYIASESSVQAYYVGCGGYKMNKLF